MYEEFFTKEIEFMGTMRSILVQNENGPCALLALANYLILLGAVRVDTSSGIVNAERLVELIANCLLDRQTTPSNDISDAVGVLHSLIFGMHVNVNFGSPSGFHETAEVAIFRLLGSPLYHGWVVSPEDHDLFPYLCNLTYDDAVTKLATDNLASPEAVHEAAVIRTWLDDTPTQLTVDGLSQILTLMPEASLAILFSNNHLSTITKQGGALFTLVTDAGYADRSDIVWEALDQVDGDTRFLPAFRAPLPPPRPSAKRKDHCFIC
jgi:ubiquitin carboxyl-terminal hydrolase MINDY-1/2